MLTFDTVDGAGDLADVGVADPLHVGVALALGCELGGWWADPALGSDVHRATTEADVKAAVESALSWLIADGQADKVDVRTALTAGPTTSVSVYVDVVLLSGEHRALGPFEVAPAAR